MKSHKNAGGYSLGENIFTASSNPKSNGMISTPTPREIRIRFAWLTVFEIQRYEQYLSPSKEPEFRD